MVVSNTELVENAVIEALKIQFPDFDVESFPVDFKQYTFTSPLGCFLVRFLSNDFSEQTTIWEVNQNQTMHFSITSIYRGLGRYSEAYYPQQVLRDTIQGLEVLGRKIVLENEQFLTEIDTDLYFGLKCKIQLYEDEGE